jgi:DNA-binding response OmpR family regulator
MNKKIMICDDSKEILDLLAIILSAEGYLIETEFDSSKLISRISKNIPDLLILDLWMPILNGEQILNLIKATPALSNIKVILISASLDGKLAYRSSNADDYINKPFDIDDLLSKVTVQLT